MSYNGWSNRATWAMNLNITNEYGLYMELEGKARYAAVGNDPNNEDPIDGRSAEECVDDFHAELSFAIRQYGEYCVAERLLPDFMLRGMSRRTPDPKDNDGPDDITQVDWLEIAMSYDLNDYV
jgi:hypothetical protein